MEKKFQIKTNKNRKKINNEISKIDENNVSYVGIIALSILSFSLGIGWYIPGGIIPELSYTFNVSITDSNLSLTLYLAGFIIIAPTVATFFYKFKRKKIVMIATAIYIVSNFLICFSTNFSELLVFRFTSGCAHGAFVALGSLMVTAMAPKNKRGLSLSIFYSALYFATFTVVPIFTYVSTLGWNSQPDLLQNLSMVNQYWRWGFFVTAALSIVSLFLTFIWVPNDLHLVGQRNIKREMTILWFWPFLLDMLFAVLIFMIIFVVYPLLQELWVSGDGYGVIFSQKNLLAVLLAVYGICSFLGNQGGGFFADGKTFPTIYVMLTLLVLDIVLLIISCLYHNGGGILACTLALATLAYTSLSNIYAIGYSLARYHDKSENIDFSSGVITFMVGLGGLIGTAISGPLTQDPLHPEEFDPSHFINVCYVVLALTLCAFLVLLPLHWYLLSARLVNTKNKKIQNIFLRFPLYIDKFYSQEAYDYYVQQVNSNVKRKIIAHHNKKSVDKKIV